jgi:hypothetical protein
MNPILFALVLGSGLVGGLEIVLGMSLLRFLDLGWWVGWFGWKVCWGCVSLLKSSDPQ